MQEECTENRVGERLRASIEGRDWTLAGFSRRCGVPYRSLQDYVSGKSKPGFDQLSKFAENGLDVHYILTGKSENNTENSYPMFVQFGGVQINKYAFKPGEIEPILDKIENEFSLRDWISIWDKAESMVPPHEMFDVNSSVRQGVVVYRAANIVLGLVERMRSLGWISR